MSLYCPHIGERVTIRGQCEECEPDLHEAHRHLGAYIESMERIFTKTTGKTALEDWHGFEAFMVNRGSTATELQREGESSGVIFDINL